LPLRTFTGVLFNGFKSDRNEKLAFVNVSPNISRILGFSGYLGVISIYNSLKKYIDLEL
jgi:hypothetical protein